MILSSACRPWPADRRPAVPGNAWRPKQTYTTPGDTICPVLHDGDKPDQQMPDEGRSTSGLSRVQGKLYLVAGYCQNPRTIIAGRSERSGKTRRHADSDVA